MDPDLDGRLALVTGTNNPLGIGAAIARALAAQGVRIALAPYPTDGAWPPGGALTPGGELYAAGNAANGRYVRDELVAAGATAEVFEVDLAVPEECGSLFDRIEAALGPVDILVNNAAHSVPDTFQPADGTSFYRESSTISAASLDRHYAVNTRAPALLMAEFHRRHVARDADRGRVVNVSTDGAPVFPTEVSYGATKNALESLSRSAAHELGPAGITVNIVSPGPIQSGWVTDDMLPKINADTPLGRVGTPEDVADAVVLLASAQARWLTGQTVYVGGGHRMV
ncbi:MAG: SDR family oxidoreductase [Actinocatenispora sp.]